nr:immunoglobulin heavy chain junction region [Mus musculus]
CARDDYDAAYW